MRRNFIRTLMMLALVPLGLAATSQAYAQQTIGKLEKLSPEFDKLVPATSKIEVVAKGSLGPRDQFGSVEKMDTCFSPTFHAIRSLSFNPMPSLGKKSRFS